MAVPGARVLETIPACVQHRGDIDQETHVQRRRTVAEQHTQDEYTCHK